MYIPDLICILISQSAYIYQSLIIDNHLFFANQPYTSIIDSSIARTIPIKRHFLFQKLYRSSLNLKPIRQLAEHEKKKSLPRSADITKADGGGGHSSRSFARSLAQFAPIKFIGDSRTQPLSLFLFLSLSSPPSPRHVYVSRWRRRGTSTCAQMSRLRAYIASRVAVCVYIDALVPPFIYTCVCVCVCTRASTCVASARANCNRRRCYPSPLILYMYMYIYIYIHTRTHAAAYITRGRRGQPRAHEARDIARRPRALSRWRRWRAEASFRGVPPRFASPRCCCRTAARM